MLSIKQKKQLYRFYWNWGIFIDGALFISLVYLGIVVFLQ